MDATNVFALIIGGAFWLVLIVGLLHRLFRDRLSRQRTVKARIVRKRDSTGENFTVYGALGRRQTTFFLLDCMVGGKVRTFEVSPLLFDRVRDGEEGQLTYQGNRGIDWES